MSSINVKSLLFISSIDKIYSNSFLFHCAKYWADKGNKVLYITHQPMENLPLSIGNPRDAQNLENFCLIRFLYLPNWEDLLKHCYSIHFQSNPASVIIIQELENYCASDRDDRHDHVSLICASLLQATAICAAKNSKPAFLINGFNSENSMIYRTITKSFFHNIWELCLDGQQRDGICRKCIKLTNLSQIMKLNDVKLFLFSENHELSFLNFEAVFESFIESTELQ